MIQFIIWSITCRSFGKESPSQFLKAPLSACLFSSTYGLKSKDFFIDNYIWQIKAANPEMKWKPFHLKINTWIAILKQRQVPTLIISSMKYTWLTGSLFFIKTFCRCCTWKNVTRNLSVITDQSCNCSFCNRSVIQHSAARQWSLVDFYLSACSTYLVHQFLQVGPQSSTESCCVSWCRQSSSAWCSWGKEICGETTMVIILTQE